MAGEDSTFTSLEFMCSREYQFAMAAKLLEVYNMPLSEQVKLTPKQEYDICFHKRDKDGVKVPAPNIEIETIEENNFANAMAGLERGFIMLEGFSAPASEDQKTALRNKLKEKYGVA